MKVLDLFCGAGGASMGYWRAGFEPCGVDIVPQKNYPFRFILSDALVFLLKVKYGDYDLIHASPPCQAYSIATLGRRKAGKVYSELVDVVRYMLVKIGTPFVLENVPGAPLSQDLVLCGTMFDLGVFRHRIFEINGFNAAKLPHWPHKGKLGDGKYFCPCGTPGEFSARGKRIPKGKASDWKRAMGIDWMTASEISQAIPPAYTEYIGREAVQTKIGTR